MPLMSREEVEDFLDREFPQIHAGGRIFSVEAVAHHRARMRMAFAERNLRPGGTLSGPSLMALTDLAFYAAVLSTIGPVALAVTTNLSFNFLRRPAPGDVMAECRLLKVGRRLIVGEASLHSEGLDDPICHATGTYSVPP
jgi:uncharacterized protein (TIGR00369 family)